MSAVFRNASIYKDGRLITGNAVTKDGKLIFTDDIFPQDIVFDNCLVPIKGWMNYHIHILVNTG